MSNYHNSNTAQIKNNSTNNKPNLISSNTALSSQDLSNQSHFNPFSQSEQMKSIFGSNLNITRWQNISGPLSLLYNPNSFNQLVEAANMAESAKPFNLFFKMPPLNTNKIEFIVQCTIIYAYYPSQPWQYLIKTNVIDSKYMSIAAILNSLSKEIDWTNKAISYYNDDFDYFVYWGKFPCEDNKYNLWEKSKKLTWKLRHIITKNDVLHTEWFEEENENIDEKNTNRNIDKKSKRAKERKIGDIIMKVYMWRKLYFGYTPKNGKEIKMSLDEAAEQIGISKKSLDDYLIQLRIGKLNGFNFNEHKNDKVGILRAFVKKIRNIDRGNKG